MLTRGEELLLAAEMRARRAIVRRRMTVLGAPVLLAVSASTAGLIGAQHARAVSGGGPPHLLAHAAAIAFTLALVALPALGAVRARRMLPAVVAIACGPVLTPMLFGPGGWRWWQTALVGVACALVSSAAMRSRAGRAARPAAI